ncbi:MAG: flagellar basal body rod protein FlgB [Anaerohalosphaera sp.]|nr:flagellar basal body rod protein FlgB [Anaerohalosphaera sp.]
MSQTDNITGLLQAGMRAEQLRQMSIASNVANLDTPGYKTIRVKFEDLLGKALHSGDSSKANRINPELFSPENSPVKPNGNDVRLEDEIGKMVENNLKYTTYIRLLQKKYGQIDQAINIR